MSRPNGAQGFIDRRQGAASPSIQSGRPIQKDRSRALLAKVNNHDLQQIHNIGRSIVPVDDSNNNHYDYDMPQHQQYLPQQEDDYRRGGLDDTTLGSDFDQTLSENDFRNGNPIGEEDISDDDGEPEHNQQGYGAQFYSQPSQSLVQPAHHSLKHQPNTLSITNLKAESQDILRQSQPIAYTGRFESQPGRITTLAHHPLHDEGQHNGYPKKRAHSPEHERPRIEPRGEEYSLSRQQRNQSPYPDESPERAGGHYVDLREDQFGLNSNQDENLRVSPSHGRKNNSSHQSSPPKAIALPVAPDYDDDILKSMQYTILETQSWEEVPRGKEYEKPSKLDGPDVTIADKIKFYMGEDEDTQGSFYGNLSMDEWEEAGDWFIDSFSGLMKELKNKRKEKRAITEKFEEEIMRREKAVRDKSDKLDSELRAMRTGGEDLLKGKKL